MKYAVAPDAIIILSGGTVLEKDGSYRSTSYDESDALGILGGYARVEGAALLSKKFPEVLVVTTSKRNPGEPTHAEIMAGELKKLGVKENKIVLENNSTNTLSQIVETLKIAQEKKWKRVFFISSDWHIPRIKALCENLGEPVKGIELIFVGAEDAISDENPDRARQYEIIKNTQAYKDRLVSEARGVKMIKNDTYGRQPTDVNDKLERIG